MGKSRNGITTNAEDYLERIHELIESKGYARVSDIADALKLSRPTVSIMVQRLSRAGYVNYEKYRGLSLTEEGTAVARRIQSRHVILNQFLTLLDLPKKVVARDIEGIEHHLSPETLDRLATLVEHWKKNSGELRAALGKPKKKPGKK